MTEESTRITTGAPSEPVTPSDTVTPADLQAEFEELHDDAEDLANDVTKKLILAGLGTVATMVLLRWLLGRRSKRGHEAAQTTMHPLGSGTLDLLGSDVRGLGAVVGKRVVRKSLFKLAGKWISAALAAGVASFLFGNKTGGGK